MQENSVSVIVPAYNREKTIKRCIYSIIHQTIKPHEIIVIDDGSSDYTVTILNELQLECNYLRVIRQNHRGAQAARNLGILNAEGKYIAFLDSDDEWLPQLLERELNFILKEQGNCVLYGDCYVCSGHRKRWWKLPRDNEDMYASLLKHPGPMFQSLLVPRKLFFKIGLLDENVVAYQEWDTAIRLSKEVKFIHIHEPLFIYHQHLGETISKNLNKDIQGYAYIVKKFHKEILKQCGFKFLGEHYMVLIKKCFKCRNFQGIIFVFKLIFVYIFGVWKKNT